MTKVKGTVEGVGDKFNGSLKVNGSWHNLKKGVKQVAKVGDSVELEIGEWEFKGKTGTNVVAINVLGSAPAKVEDRPEVPRQAVSVGRDFDKEARGKTRCALLEALWSNPSFDASSTKELFELVDKGVAFVFGDK